MSLGKPLRLLPGLLLLFAIGYGGKAIEHAISVYGKAHHLALPNIEYVLWAILIGLVIKNTVGVPKFFEAGVATYEFWLKFGIVLLGSRFLLGDALKLGSASLILVIVEIVFSIAFMTWLGNLFGLKPKLTSLLAVGSGICGVSAIIATKDAIDADNDDFSYAAAVILSVGAASLFIFPFVGHLLGMGDHAYGMWAGLAVDNTAEATAAGALYSDAAAKVAVLAKTTRNAMIGFVVLGYALYWAKQGMAKKIGNKGRFLWEKFPKFVLGFLFISLLASLHVFSKGQITSLANLSRWAFLLTFAGVGLKTDIRALAEKGGRPLAVGLIGESAIAVTTLLLVLGTARVIGF